MVHEAKTDRLSGSGLLTWSTLWDFTNVVRSNRLNSDIKSHFINTVLTFYSLFFHMKAYQTFFQ